MKKIILLIICLLVIPIVFGSTCEERLDNGSDCLMLTPVISCTTYNITHSNKTIVTENGNLTLLNASVYYFNFTEEVGDYIITLCDGGSREFRVTETYDTKFNNEESARMSIAIAVFLVAITIGILYIAVHQKNKNFQLFFGLLGFFFLIVDVYLAARLTEAINPTFTGVIDSLYSIYNVLLIVFAFLMSIAMIMLLWKAINYYRSIHERKMIKDEEEWLNFKD